MPTSRLRKFTLLDLIIIVAAAAVMLAFFRFRFEEDEFPSSLRAREDFLLVALWVERLLPCASVWTMTVLLLRLRGPRPSLRRLYREPGFVACLAASLVLLLGFPTDMIGDLAIRKINGGDLWQVLFVGEFALGTFQVLPPRISLAVATVWIAQAVCGYWRPQPHWIDRLGRAAGAFWIAVIPIHELAKYWRFFID